MLTAPNAMSTSPTPSPIPQCPNARLDCQAPASSMMPVKATSAPSSVVNSAIEPFGQIMIARPMRMNAAPGRKNDHQKWVLGCAARWESVAVTVWSSVMGPPA